MVLSCSFVGFKTGILLALYPGMISIYLLSALLLSGAAYVQQALGLELPDGITLTEENPLAPYARKKNGEYRSRFKVPYKAIADYYQFIGQGTILKNPNPPKILDIDMDVVPTREVDELEFYVSLKNKKAYTSLIINPHTVTQLFVVDAKAYSELAGREDFVNKSQSKMNMTNGNVFYFDLPEHKEKERKRETWNKRLFKSIFAATERGVKLDIIGNGIDGRCGEVSNMFKRMYLKNPYRINPIPRGTAFILADFMDKIAAKKNQPYLEFLTQVKNIRAWTHFQHMHSKKFQFDRSSVWSQATI
jgi:hypothetical protein